MTGNILNYFIDEDKKCAEKFLNTVVKSGVKVILVVTPPKRTGSSKGTLELQRLVEEIAENQGCLCMLQMKIGRSLHKQD